MNNYSKECRKILKQIKKLNNKNKKKTCFLIGNTVKSNNKDYYFPPLREFKDFIIAGAIVYNEKKHYKYQKL